MSEIDKRQFDAAGAMTELLAARLGKNREVHSETVVAAAARMAGTMLFRSFGLNTAGMTPGAVVLSEQANVKGPELINIVLAMLEKFELQPDKDKMAATEERGEAPKLTILEMQELLDDELTQILETHRLSLEEGAQAGALAAAWLIRECAPQIGLETGFHIALYGFIEGSKTVPRNGGIPAKKETKQPWYKFWR